MWIQKGKDWAHFINLRVFFTTRNGIFQRSYKIPPHQNNNRNPLDVIPWITTLFASSFFNALLFHIRIRCHYHFFMVLFSCGNHQSGFLFQHVLNKLSRLQVESISFIAFWLNRDEWFLQYDCDAFAVSPSQCYCSPPEINFSLDESKHEKWQNFF